MKPWWTLGVLLSLLCGCGSDAQYKMDLEAVQQKRVSSDIYQAMLKRDPLSLEQVVILSNDGVGEAVIIRAIQNGRAVYRLDSKAISHLKQSKVSDSVVDCLLQTRDTYYQNQLDRERLRMNFNPDWAAQLSNYQNWRNLPKR